MTSLTIKEELPNICRICLDDNAEDRHTIFDQLPTDVNIDIVDGRFNGIHEFLMSFTDIKLDRNDGLPYYICVYCLYLTHSAFNLYKLCNESQKYFCKKTTSVSNVNDIEMNEEMDNSNDIEHIVIKTEVEDLVTYTETSITCNDPSESINDASLFENCTQKEEEIEENEENCIPSETNTNEACYRCPACVAQFKSLGELMEHFKSHCCEPCNGVSPTENLYNEHCSIKCASLKCKSKNEALSNRNFITDPNDEKNIDYEGTFTVVKVKYASTSSFQVYKYTKYKCTKCETEVSGSEFKTHYNTHIDPIYMCEHCEETFYQKNMFVNHLGSKHPDLKFVKRNELTTTVKKNGTNVQLGTNQNAKWNYVSDYTKLCIKIDDSTFECTKCDVQVSNLHAFKLHYGSKHCDPYYKCEYCNETFYTDNNLKSHLKLLHPNSQLIIPKQQKPKCYNHEDGDNKYVCKKCGSSFSTLKHFNYHYRTHNRLSRTRLTGREFVCEECGNTFPTAGSLNFHLKVYHEISRRFKCQMCDKAFRKKRELIIHNGYHIGSRPYICHCGAAFKSEVGLSMHTISHTTGRRFQCDRCNKAFFSPFTLRRHRFKHANSKRQQNDCDECELSFITKSGLRYHKQMHANYSNA